MAILADALQVCALDTNYYVALEALDDLSYPTVAQPFDFIDEGGGSYVIRPWEGKFTASRVALASSPSLWRGPYVSFQPGRIQLADGPYDKGSPLDPWGTPYYFFSPLGLLRGDSGSVTLELYGDQFDRYTIVSLGPDRVMSQDDLTYQFGSGVTARVISSLRGPRVIPLSRGPNAQRDLPPPSAHYLVGNDSLLTVRGVNLYDSYGQATVLWGTTTFTDVLTTSAREITVWIPPTLEGEGQLRVVSPAGQTDPVLVRVTSFTPADDWELFE